MKKAIKKLMAALLAVAMLCAMAVPAFAAGTGEKGTITINNAVDGMTYNIYRILDVDTYDSTANSVVYKTNDRWGTFFTEFVSQAPWKNYIIVNNDSGTVTVKEGLPNDFASSFAAAAKSFVSSIGTDVAPVTADSTGVVNFNDLTLGYYLVVSSGWDEGIDVVCSLDTTKPNATIEEKNGKPSIDKEIVDSDDTAKKNTANIGDYVQFQITVNVIDGKPTNYVIHDKMSKGLTFVENNTSYPVKVQINGVETNAYSFVADKADPDCTFELKINEGALKANDKITVTYYGQVNSDAEIIKDPNTNSAHLTYGDNGKGTCEPTETYVYGFKVFKYADGKDDTLLPGAEFRLYKTVAGVNHYALFNANGLLTGWTTDKDSSDIVLTSNDKAALTLNGLAAGTYYLEETKAPDGYNKLEGPVTVTIGKDGNVVPAVNGIVYVSNKAGATLPSTGGIGTTIFYVVGGGLMVAAAVLLITKKRMENK